MQVAAPRYTMPTDQILSSFPPANAEGAFGDRLPQIVLKRRTLPWERNPAGRCSPSDDAVARARRRRRGRGRSCPPPRRWRDCVTAGTTLLDPDDKDVEQGLYLAVTETVVKKIFPCEEDLPLLAHVREVDVNDTELANGDDDGWLAVVLANRLPVFDKATASRCATWPASSTSKASSPRCRSRCRRCRRFEFALAQDWCVLAQRRPARRARRAGDGRRAARQRGAARRGRRCSAPAAGRARRARLRRRQRRSRHRPQPVASLDGAATMAQPSVAQAVDAQATQQVAAAALDPDAKRLVRDTMAQGFRLPDRAVSRSRRCCASRCWRTGRSPPTKAPPSRR